MLAPDQQDRPALEGQLEEVEGGEAEPEHHCSVSLQVGNLFADS